MDLDEFLGPAPVRTMDVTKILTSWETFWKLIESNFDKDTLIMFSHNDAPENQEIFERLGKLGCINRTDWGQWISQGVVCFRQKHLLLGIGLRERNKKFKYRHLVLERQ